VRCACCRRTALRCAASVCRTFADVEQHEAWIGPATLELRPNAQVPVHLLAVREVLLGLHRVPDLSLPPGRVIHRY
jgi:acetoacetate decarboxylase